MTTLLEQPCESENSRNDSSVCYFGSLEDVGIVVDVDVEVDVDIAVDT